MFLEHKFECLYAYAIRLDHARETEGSASADVKKSEIGRWMRMGGERRKADGEGMKDGKREDEFVDSKDQSFPLSSLLLSFSWKIASSLSSIFAAHATGIGGLRVDERA